MGSRKSGPVLKTRVRSPCRLASRARPAAIVVLPWPEAGAEMSRALAGEAGMPSAFVRWRRSMRQPPAVGAEMHADAGVDDREQAGHEDAVERAGSADGGDRRAEPLNAAEIEQVGANQRPEAAADIGKRRGIAPRKQDRDDGGHDGRNEYRLCDAE